MFFYKAGKAPHRYVVQEGDATMYHTDSKPGQKTFFQWIKSLVKKLSRIFICHFLHIKIKPSSLYSGIQNLL